MRSGAAGKLHTDRGNIYSPVWFDPGLGSSLMFLQLVIQERVQETVQIVEENQVTVLQYCSTAVKCTLIHYI